MKITLFANDGLYEFKLPMQVFGTFAFDYDDNEIEKLINVEAKDNSWYLMSTANVKVFDLNNNYVLNVKIYENNFYSLEKDSKKYLIYIEGLYDNTFKNYKYNKDINIIVGKEKDSSINYNIPYINSKIVIKSNGNNIILENNNQSFVYVNKRSIHGSNNLINFGDTIELFGLKIIILKGIVLINNPNNSVFVNNLLCGLEELSINISDGYNTEEIKDKELYSDNAYFSKSPRIRRIITTKRVKIDAPPQVNDNDEVPLIYTLGPMVTMGMTSATSLMSALLRINSGEATFKNEWTTIIVGTTMLVTTILWPMMTQRYMRVQQTKKKKKSILKYREYLNIKKKEIEEEAKLQKDILIENLISLNECLEMIMTRKLGLWGRRIEQEDFLTVRIGMGNYPLDVVIDCPEDGFSIEDLPLKDEAMMIAKDYEVLKNVPIKYSFINKGMTAIMGNTYKVNNFMNNIILQLVTFHSYEDLKIVVLTNDKNISNWDYVRYLPHNFDNTKKFRFFASNLEETKEVSNYLEQELYHRLYDEEMNSVEVKYTDNKPYYLIITDNYTNIRRTGIMKLLTEINVDAGFSLVILENRLSKLPSKLDNFIQIGDKSSSILENAYEKQNIINFNDEINNGINMYNISKILSNIPIEFEKGGKILPDTITFLEMEHVGKVEQLNIINRWKSNDPVQSLRAEVGVDESGDTLYLDLHEKYHGPHGLIAGMTGSGKSEFIISYVLSMAINYSPNEVSFILIDYKGGGLAGAFENQATGVKLPHLAGTITNLDKAEMDRTLVSIDSEVRRRQKVFNEARDKLGESTIDIYKYQRFFREGKLTEPVPHLIIICDEFAELKSQQPDFMDNLISIARIGRSLGVHLILATQKPSGVVDDQIWSNSKFRVCLKVQERSDSNEMLKRPEAAEIKQVGRFYLQVGYNELFTLGQSAWCGAKYYPSDKIKKNIDKSVNIINNYGYAVKSIEDSKGNKGESQGEELAGILKYIIEASKIENVSSNRLWLDNVPMFILVDNLISKYKMTFNKNVVEAIVGEYDDPSNQKQGLVKINLNTNGNTIVYGAYGNDKEMFLSSMIYSTATRHYSDEINYYIIDYGSETLRKFSSFPHIGDIVSYGEDEKLGNLFKMIKEIISERKKLFASFGGEYNNYIRQTKESLPLIGIIINNYDSFLESNSALDEELTSLTRDGQRYGVFFVITANGDSSVRRRITQNFNSIFAMRLNDKDDYNMLFGRIENTPRDNDGRGMFKTETTFEFQAARITEEDKVNDYLIEVGSKLKDINSYVAKSIPTLPDIVTINYVSKYIRDLTKVPIGVSKNSLEIVNYDFTGYLSTFILSTTSLNTSYFSKALIREISSIKNLQLIVVDINSELLDIKDKINYYYDNNSNSIMDTLLDYIRRLKESSTKIKTVIYFQNFNKFITKVDGNKIEEFSNEIKDLENISLLIADDYKKLKKYEYENWYRNIVNDTDGIWIGTGLSDQNIFKLSRLTKEMEKTYRNNFGFVITDGRAELVKLVENVDNRGDINGK